MEMKIHPIHSGIDVKIDRGKEDRGNEAQGEGEGGAGAYAIAVNSFSPRLQADSPVESFAIVKGEAP